MSELKLRGKIALVTGAGRGIGKATSKLLAKNGAEVVLTARTASEIDKVAENIVEDNGGALPISGDITNGSFVTNLFSQIQDQYGRLDILINNAGKAVGLDLLHEGSLDDWEDMIDTNIKGLLYVSRAVIPHMVTRNSGHVINIGSIAGRWVYPKGAVYNATKFAVWALNEGMNIDLVGTKIRVSSVDPGMTETEFSEVRFHGDKERADKVYEGTQPLTGEDIADAIIYVANTPEHVDIINLVMMPTQQRHAFVLHRE